MRISDWSSDVCSSDLLAVSFATPSASCGPLLILAPLAETDAAAELGTRAIPVKRTRFDERWDHVRRAAGEFATGERCARAGQGREDRKNKRLTSRNSCETRMTSHV